jgi:uncharacterized protein (TIRG00374 family)
MPADDHVPAPDEKPTHSGRLRLVVGVCIGAGAIYAVVSSAGGFADSFHALAAVDDVRLGMGAVAEAVSYAILGVLLRRLTGGRINRRTALRLALLVKGLGNLLPAAPAEGLTMASSEMRRRGVEAHRSRIALGLMQWYTTRAIFGLAALDALAVVAVASISYPGRAPGRFVLAAIALGVIALLLATAWLASQRQTIELIAIAADRLVFWKPSAPTDERRLRGTSWHEEIHEVLGPGRHQAAFAGLAFASCLADGACFRYALVAVGAHVAGGVFLLAYAVGMIAAMVPLVPAGLGVVEVVVPALLHRAGVPLATALAGVLAYRLLGTFLPAVCGAIALLRLRLATVRPLMGTAGDAAGPGR